MSDKTDSEDDTAPDPADAPADPGTEPSGAALDPARAKPKRRLKLTKMPKRAAEADRSAGEDAAQLAGPPEPGESEAAPPPVEAERSEPEPAAEAPVELTEELGAGAAPQPAEPGEAASRQSSREPPAPRSAARRRSSAPTLVLLVMLTLAAGALAWWEWPRGEAPVETARTPAALTGAELSEIEQLLSDLQIDPGPVDGVIDEATGEAIRTFQEIGGLPVDGEPSAALLNELREVKAEMN